MTSTPSDTAVDPTSPPVRFTSFDTTAGSGTPRVKLYSRAVLAAVVAAFVISVVGASGADGVSGRLGGDFPAFYAAGSIVAEGDWHQLYEPERQLAAQTELFGDSEGSFLYFAYPPHAGAAYRPLAALPYRAAYAVHTVAMAAALVGALWLLRPVSRVVRSHFELVATASLLCYPMLRAVTGGQNTAMSLLAVAAVWRLVDDDRDVAAGLTLALLLYKPQLAVPIVGLLLVAGRWRAVAASLGGAAVLWGVGAALMGAGWLSTWWSDVSAFAELDADINGHNAVSWLGAAEAVFGSGSSTARLVAGPLMLATVVGAVMVWRRRDVALATQMAVAVCAALMVSPHAMFYDAALLVVPALVLVDRLGRRAIGVLAALWVGSWTHLWADAVAVAPLFFVVVAFVVFAVVHLRRDVTAAVA